MASPVRAAERPSPRRTVVGVGCALLLALPLVAVGGCGGPDGLEGTVVEVDATGKGDQPVGGGWVAVLEDDALLGFLAGAGIDVPGRADLPYAAGRVLHDDVTRSGGSLAAVDQDGRFALTVTGRHTVCRLVEAPQVDLLKGCAVVDLPTDGRLTLSVGDTGLHATLHD
jgi:hypothetical protein